MAIPCQLLCGALVASSNEMLQAALAITIALRAVAMRDEDL